jgi:hypothetical protein
MFPKMRVISISALFMGLCVESQKCHYIGDFLLLPTPFLVALKDFSRKALFMGFVRKVPKSQVNQKRKFMSG